MNVLHFNNKTLNKAIVKNTKVYSDYEGYDSMVDVKLIDFDGVNHSSEYHKKDGFYLEKNDTVSYRNLHNNSVRIIKKNGKKVQDYYYKWDYLSLIIVIIIPIIYFNKFRFIKKH
ncbi:hypothetical protein [Tenacibaculum sp. E3R01]|uniref:hypothetical protein n=1 Tax=Tenacibaculum sp. E3R01 TaxID=2267227 RepID=UPI0011BF92CD|nr:hypothetical protein [Tenacibaculum sp. E3R01]